MTHFGGFINRRSFLKRSGQAAGLLAAAPLLRGRAAAAEMTPLSVRLSWVSNAEFAGEYFADQRGYYKEAGFDPVTIVPGGPSAPPTEIDLVQGKCYYGMSLPDLTAAAISEGAEIKTIAAQFQKNPFCIVSLAKNPILEPKDMIGKKIGVQAVNETTWAVFLKLNNIDPASINKVPVQFDPTPLAAGEVDGWMSFVTNEPITLGLKGIETKHFLFADHNFGLVAETVVVRQETIDKERDKLKALLKAEIKGWKDSLKEPETAAKFAVEIYGKSLGLNLEEQILEVKAQNELIVTDETRKNGILTLSPEAIERNMKVLAVSGLDIKAEQLFDMSLIDEVYAEDPSLKA